MRRVMMILMLITATALLTGCHDGYYSGGFGYGYSSEVLLYGGHHGYGHYGYGYGHRGGHGQHGGHSRGHH